MEASNPHMSRVIPAHHETSQANSAYTNKLMPTKGSHGLTIFIILF